MQDNVITLSVDVANNSTLVNQAYTRHEENTNRSTYVGPAHALDSRNVMQFYRTAPRQNGEFRGTAKSSVKFTEDFAVNNASGTGTITSPLIAEVSFSVPVGVATADILEMRQRLIALLDDDSIMGDLNELLEI